LPKIVPYEWFRLRPERPNVEAKYQRILLLWFDEDVLAAPAHGTPSPQPPAPLRQYAELLCSYLKESGPAKVKILGPQLSTTLKAMVDEIERSQSEKDWASGSCAGSKPAAFYVSQATVSDATLLPKCSGGPCSSHTTLSTFFHDKKKIPLHRLTATDDALALAIGDELQRRDIKLGENGGPQIALISEWDTLYGRALPDSMARCLGRSACEPAGDDPFLGKKWLHPFAYVRGLDGQMPNAGGTDVSSGAKDNGKSDKDGKDSAKNRPDPNVRARAEGQSQFDYLQRLGDRIRQLDTDLRAENKNGIEAVGVLGSDLYDKLLVLQALRPLLPDARFFTTDLDALLLHPAEQKVTRNLLVASGFGLRLRPEIQGAIPPFRSNYQTAEFIAARMAIRSGDPPNHCWTNSPLLFEIGSRREFQFFETPFPVHARPRRATARKARPRTPAHPFVAKRDAWIIGRVGLS
jgi:hypothetical protein